MKLIIVIFLFGLNIDLCECLNCYYCTGGTGCNDPFNSLGSGVSTTGTNSANTYCVKQNYIGTYYRSGASSCSNYWYSSNAYQTCCTTDYLFLQSTQSISCYSCSSATNSYCNDPFSSNGTFVTTISNQFYCQKSVNVNGLIIRSGVGSVCSTSGVVGVTSIYCCSDQNYCNKSIQINKSFLSFILLIISSLF